MPFKNQKILVIVAHPDDEWFLLEKLRAARNVKVLVLSTSTRHFQQRRGETTDVVNMPEFPNISVEFLNDRRVIWDGENLNHIEDLASEIARTIRTFSPDLILTHDYENGHPDHDAAFLSTVKASLDNPIDVYCFCSYRRGAGGLMAFFKPLVSLSDNFTLKFSFFELFRMFRLSQHYKTERVTMSILGSLGLFCLFLRGGLCLRDAKGDQNIIRLPKLKSLTFTRYNSAIETYQTALRAFNTQAH